MASALGLVSIATGVDDAGTRDALLGLGCPLGSGDLYHGLAADIMSEPAAGSTRPPVAADASPN
jgi:hypothetical protein